ncbi:MAG: VOC family protein [Spirochaetales bacterium]|nr:VOC family protein [Spirochaetales bacterium]
MIFDSIHHIAIIASDYNKAKDFYVNKLGLKINREVERKEREDFIIFLDGGENIEIELFIEKNPPKRLTRPEARGLRHLAFRVDDIYKSVEELKKRGIETEEIRIDPLNGKHMTFFFDPDGLPLELHE